MGKFNANLCNVTPIDLNFLLYVHNVYLNLNTEQIRFPGRYPGGDTIGFLPYEHFVDTMKKNWEQILSAYNQNICREIETLQMDRYASWFTDDAHGRRTLQDLWDAFNLWWWPDYGIRQFMDRISDPCVPVIGDQLSRMARDAGYAISNDQLALLMVFDKPPAQFKRQDRRVYVACLAEILRSDMTLIARSMFDNLIAPVPPGWQ
jgi:hypothetical protein